MKKVFIAVAGIFALIGAFFSGACVVYYTLKADGDNSVTEEPGELKIKTKRRKYTETKLPENKHYGF